MGCEVERNIDFLGMGSEVWWCQNRAEEKKTLSVFVLSIFQFNKAMACTYRLIPHNERKGMGPFLRPRRTQD